MRGPDRRAGCPRIAEAVPPGPCRGHLKPLQGLHPIAICNPKRPSPSLRAGTTIYGNLAVAFSPARRPRESAFLRPCRSDSLVPDGIATGKNARAERRHLDERDTGSAKRVFHCVFLGKGDESGIGVARGFFVLRPPAPIGFQCVCVVARTLLAHLVERFRQQHEKGAV